jgi:hypothetical protein
VDRHLSATASPRGGESLSRRTRWALLLLAVLIVHAVGVSWLEDTLAGWGAAQAPMPARMEVAFVQTLQPAAPAAAAPMPPARTPRPRPARPRAAVAPASAPASAPEPSASAPEPPVVQAAAAPSAPAPVEAPATTTEPAPSPEASAAPSSPASAAGPSFEWPPSTRLTYTLAGNYRGEVHGNARVQWVRAGARYQVHLDVAIGPSFAPLITRRMTSDGELGEGGLVPQRYDEATKLPFQSPRRLTVQFTAPGQVVLANGSLREVPASVQDTASQFVQLTWLFTTRPELLRVGNTIEMPLALPRRVDRWHYDVVAQERLPTPVGEIETFHLKPRRAEQRPRGELSAEVWFAPSLQYLPVRIRIQQDPETYVDLVMDAAPMQAAPEAPR